MALAVDITPARVRELREGLHLSQVEFAALVGVSPRTVQAWEAGTRPRPLHRRVLLRLDKGSGA